MKKSSKAIQWEIYELTIKHLKKLFKVRFEALKEKLQNSNRKTDNISNYGFERYDRHSLETKIETRCNEYVYDWCFGNIYRFEIYLKQFKSKDDYAKSIAQRALQENFTEHEENIKELELKTMMLNEEKNKRRTFPIEFMRKIKKIETITKPKPTQIQAIVKANETLKLYEPSDLINEYGKPTQLAISIKDSYKAQKKSL